MRDDRDRFEEAGAGVTLIGLGRPAQALMFCGRRAVPFRCLTSPDGSAHRTFGLRRGTVTELAGPGVWKHWAKNQLTGKAQGRFGQGDVARLPGTFVLDPEGVVRYAHRGERSDDTPPNDEVLRAIATLADGSG